MMAQNGQTEPPGNDHVAKPVGPVRVSGFTLFKHNFRDQAQYVIAIGLLVPAYMISLDFHSSLFYVVYGSLMCLAHYQLYSFRRFRLIRRYVQLLESDPHFCNQFMGSIIHRKSPERIPPANLQDRSLTTRDERVQPLRDSNRDVNSRFNVSDQDRLELKRHEESLRRVRLEEQTYLFDGYNWFNHLVIFFWPKLSSLIHYELDLFFRKEIQSGSMGRSKNKTKRFLYSIINQFRLNVLAIEKCELGHQTPALRKILVRDYLGIAPMENELSPEADEKSDSVSVKVGKLIEVDVDLEYIGDMNLSLLYRNFCCMKTRLGLKDIFIMLKMRFTIGPLKKEFPFIEQVSFSFYELPDFGYQGIALVELAELRMARQLLNNTIKEHLLTPYAITIRAEQVLRKLNEKLGKRKKNNQRKGAKMIAMGTTMDDMEIKSRPKKPIVFVNKAKNVDDETGEILARSEIRKSHRHIKHHEHVHPDYESLLARRRKQATTQATQKQVITKQDEAKVPVKVVHDSRSETTSVSQNQGPPHLSWLNKIGARSLLYCCFCVNCCLKICQRKSQRPQSMVESVPDMMKRVNLYSRRGSPADAKVTPEVIKINK